MFNDAGLSDIEIRITADLARLRQDMLAANSLVDRGLQSMRSAADSLKGAFSGLLGGLSVAAFGSWVKGAIDAADALDEMSQRVGVSAEELSRLQVAYQMAGLQSDTMQSSLAKLSKEMAEGNKAFDLLGVKTRNADGSLKSATEVLGSAADAFQGLRDGSAKTALAMEIFGKSGADMLPLLNEGSEGLREMAELAEDLGVAIDKETGKAAGEFNDTLDKLGLAAKGVGLALASELLPSLQGAANSMLGAVREGSAFREALSSVGEAVRLVTSALDPALKIGAAYFGLYVGLPALVTAAGAAFTGLAAALGPGVAYMMTGGVVGTSYAASLTAAGAATTGLTGATWGLNTALGVLMAAFAGWQIGSWMHENFAEARIAGVYFVETTMKAWEALKFAGLATWASIKAAFGAAFEGMGGIAAAFMDSLGSALGKLGLGSAAAKMGEWAAAVRDGTASSGTLAEELAGLRAQYRQNVAAVDDVTAAMYQDALAHDKVRAAVKSRDDVEKRALGTLKDRTAAEKAAADAAKAALQEAERVARARADARLSEDQSIEAEFQRRREEAARMQASLNDRIQGMKDEADAIDLAKRMQISLGEAVELVTIRRLEDRSIVLEAGSEAANEVQREIEKRRELLGLIGSREAREAAVKAAEEAAQAWQRTADSIGQGLTDSLFRAFEAGKGFFKTLWDGIKNTFKTTVLKLIISGQDGKSGIVGDVMGLMGLGPSGTAGSTAAGRGGSFGAFGNTLSTASSLYNWGSSAWTLGSQYLAGTMSGANVAGTAYANAMGTGLDGLLAANGAYGTAATGAGGTAGVSSGLGATGIGLLIAIGMKFAEKFYGQGYTDRSDNSRFGQVYAPQDRFNTSILRRLGVSDGMANVITGAPINTKIFGRAAPRLDGQEIVGTFGAGDFGGSVQSHILQKGGWLRSDKRWTETSALPAEMEKDLDDAAKALREHAETYARALGLPAQRLADVTSAATIKLTDDAAKNTEAINAALGEYGTALAESFAPEIAAVKREGESAADTLGRLLGSLTGANAALDGLNVILFNASVAGADAANKLVDLFGGLENLGTATADYYGRYYSEAEKAAQVTAQVTTALTDAGLAMPTTKEAFRALVEAQDLTTESGRKAFATLMGVAGAFDELSQRGAAVASERAGLERQLLELQGDTAALRRLELEALDPSNRALQELIWSLQDAGKAAEQTANAMVTLADGSQLSMKAFGARAGEVTDAQIRTAFGIPAGLASGSAAGMSPAALSALTQNQLNYAVGSSAWMGAAANSLVMGGQSYADFIATKNATFEQGPMGAGGGAAVDETKKLRESMDKLSDGLLDYLGNLRQSEMSILSPEQKYAEAKAAFEALGAGTDAATAKAAADTLLKTSRAYNASGAGYVADYSKVEALLQQLLRQAERQAGTSEAQLRTQSDGFERSTNATRAAAASTREALDKAALLAQQGTP